MATSFKVPRSPKKSIFEIDEFLGVDLTNSGTNIDERRSPNAPNMTRYVPSKVRKRMGYSDKIIFSNSTDVNRVKDSTEYYKTFTPSALGETGFDLYETISANQNFSVYFEYEAFGKHFIKFGNANYSVGENDYSESHSGKIAVKNNSSSVDFRSIFVQKNSSFTSESNYLRIKKMMVFKAVSNTPISSKEWTPAPEDNGTLYIETETTEPVYGCHVFHSGVSDGDFVTNVNRALNTSSNEKKFVFDSTHLAISLAKFRETIPKDIPVNIRLEYKATKSALIHVSTSFDGDGAQNFALDETSEWTVRDWHAILDYDCDELFVYRRSEDSIVFIRNLSVTYAKTSDYTWTPAPEDKGEIWNIKNLYNLSTENLASISECSVSRNASSYKIEENFKLVNEADYDGLTYVGFDVYSSCVDVLSSLKMSIFDSASQEKDYIYTTYKNIDNVHFDLLITPHAGGGIDSLKVEMNVTNSQSSKCTFALSNIEVRRAVKKTDFKTYSSYFIYHVGNNMYLAPNDNSWIKNICTTANKDVSKSWELNNSIYILDGKNIFTFDMSRDNLSPIGDEEGYIPTVTIGKDPSGGGKSYDDLNLLQSGFYEDFYVSAQTYPNGTNAFYLSFQHLDNDKEVKAWVLQSDATWELKKEGTQFTVDRANGIITFNSTIPKSPLTGTDNVRILAYRTVDGYADRIRKCTIGTLFGVNGASDRLFLSGNPDYPNYDWYSEQYNPTYFPDTGYSALGLETSSIVGYAIVNNYLTTFKDENEPSQSVFIREGDLVTDANTGIAKPQFKLINTLQGAGAIAKHGFGYLKTEPLFLTRSGIFAITAQDITGEKYGQNRSFYLNGQLTKEEDLEKAFAVTYNDMYLLSINDVVYALDGLQAIQTDKSEPYATRQYVGFYWNNIPATCMWTEKNTLWFGSKDGHICKFATDINELESYNDNGKAIECCWETPDIDGKLFYKNKSFRYIAIRMLAAVRTSLALYAMARGSWTHIKDDTNTGLYFDFNNIDFSKFSFSTDRTDKVSHSRIRVKKVDKARFKIENKEINEPFGLLSLALEYVESGNYKG